MSKDNVLNYGGFYIKEAVGNNIFSYDERELREIYVPKLIKTNSYEDVKIGKEVVFCEVLEGIENRCIGLENMYYLNQARGKEKSVYVFDNHNHAFYFWCKELNEGRLKKGMRLLHVDQHKDTREPANYNVDIESLQDCKRYVTEELNVGSFIKPALYHNIFQSVDIVDSTYSLEKNYEPGYVLDIDLDFFSKDMDYIDYDYKLEKVKQYIDDAVMITVASSPYFIEQEKALDVLVELFSCGKKVRFMVI